MQGAGDAVGSGGAQPAGQRGGHGAAQGEEPTSWEKIGDLNGLYKVIRDVKSLMRLELIAAGYGSI